MRAEDQSRGLRNEPYCDSEILWSMVLTSLIIYNTYVSLPSWWCALGIRASALHLSRGVLHAGPAPPSILLLMRRIPATPCTLRGNENTRAIERLPEKQNPRRACAASVSLSVCVCVCVCVCVSTHILALQATRRPISDTSGFRTTRA